MGNLTPRNSTRPPILWPEKRTRIRARKFVGILICVKLQRAIARSRARLARAAARSSAQPRAVDVRCSLVSDLPARDPSAVRAIRATFGADFLMSPSAVHSIRGTFGEGFLMFPSAVRSIRATFGEDFLMFPTAVRSIRATFGEDF